MRTTYAIAALLISAFGCSSSSDAPTTTADSGVPTDTAMAADTAPMDSGMDMGGAVDTGMVDDTPAGKPVAPTMAAVEKMAGSLHLTWKLNDTGLSSVLVFRKKDGGTYAKVYTLPGSATSQHDMSASTTGSTYCYQVQTVKAGASSDLSNELCGTP